MEKFEYNKAGHWDDRLKYPLLKAQLPIRRFYQWNGS